MKFNTDKCRLYKFEVNSKNYAIPILGSYQVSDVEEAENIRLTNEKKPVILEVGQDQLTHKAYYLSRELEKSGIHTAFFAGDRFGLGKENVEKEKLDWISMGNSSLKNWRTFRAAVKKYRPMLIEMFLGMKTFDIVYYVIYAKLKRIPIVVKCRGGEILNWEKHRIHRKMANSFALRNANIVLLRELYMPKFFVRYKIAPLSHCFLFHNHVPVSEQLEKGDELAPKILYLNTLKAFRNPMKMLDIAEELVHRNIDFKIDVVGMTDKSLNSYDVPIIEERFRAGIEERGLSQYFELHKFTNNTEFYFRNAPIFLLPTDLVFCNHSLLEGMSHGCVPIMEGGDGADLIAEDGVSGFILDGNVSEYADKIELLLKDKDLQQKMGRNAHQKIWNDFNTNTQAKKVLSLYCRELWS